MREQGMGRTRLRRFAAITIPATVATGALGVAVLQGAVAATLSSANGFQLASSGGLTTDSLKLRPGSTQAGTTSTQVSTAYAETGANTSLNGLCLGVSQAMPSVISSLLPTVGLKISSTSTVSTPNVSLNAASLDGSSASLQNVVAGVAQSAAGFSTAGQDSTTGYQGAGFGLTSTQSTATTANPNPAPNTITGLKAQSYAVTLAGLSLNSGLSIGVDATGIGGSGFTGECY